MQVSPPPPSTTPTPDELRAWPQLQTAIEAGQAGKRRRTENEGAGFSNEGGAKTTENLPGSGCPGPGIHMRIPQTSWPACVWILKSSLLLIRSLFTQ